MKSGSEIRRHLRGHTDYRGNPHYPRGGGHSEGSWRVVQTVDKMSLGRYLVEMAPIYVMFVITAVMAVMAIIKS